VGFKSNYGFIRWHKFFTLQWTPAVKRMAGFMMR
jgi:hypothetical protein